MKEKTPQVVIDFFKEEGYCLNESKKKLIVIAYHMGIADSNMDEE